MVHKWLKWRINGNVGQDETGYLIDIIGHFQ